MQTRWCSVGSGKGKGSKASLVVAGPVFERAAGGKRPGDVDAAGKDAEDVSVAGGGVVGGGGGGEGGVVGEKEGWGWGGLRRSGVGAGSFGGGPVGVGGAVAGPPFFGGGGGVVVVDVVLLGVNEGGWVGGGLVVGPPAGGGPKGHSPFPRGAGGVLPPLYSGSGYGDRGQGPCLAGVYKI